MADELLALSFLQPWLWAILEGHKPVENRSWKPPRSVVGRRIALHASAGYDREGDLFVRRLVGTHRNLRSPMVACRSAIVGTAVIVGAFRPAGSRAEVVGPLLDVEVDRLAASPWAFGPWIWKVADVRKLRAPVPCKGALGFWKVPADAAALVYEDLAR